VNQEAKERPGAVAQGYNPSYSRDRDLEASAVGRRGEEFVKLHLNQ
jgi:hypothetical protein